MTAFVVPAEMTRIGGPEQVEAFVQKMELDAGLGRRAIVVLWIVGSLVEIGLGRAGLL
jgi:hypothetical protein